MEQERFIDISEDVQKNSLSLCYPRAHDLLVNLIQYSNIKVYALRSELEDSQVIETVSFDIPSSIELLSEIMNFGLKSHVDEVHTKMEKLSLSWDFSLVKN